MKAKVIASLLVLSVAFSLLLFMFVTGCGTNPSSSGGGGGTVPSTARLYITDVTNKRVLVIDPSASTLITSIELPGTASPKWMAIHPNGSKVYVADEGSREVYVIDTATNTVEARVIVCSTPRGMVSNNDGSKLFVACAGGGDVAIIDTATNTHTNSDSDTIYNTGTGSSYGIALSHLYNKVYVADYSGNAIYYASAEGNATVSNVALSSPYDLVSGLSGEALYVTSYGTGNWLVSYEAYGMTVVQSWESSAEPGQHGFRNIAISPNGNYLFAGDHDYSYIDSLNPNVGGSLISINISSAAAAYSYPINQIAFSDDSSKAFVVNQYGTSELVVIDTASKVRVGALVLPSSYYFGIVYKP